MTRRRAPADAGTPAGHLVTALAHETGNLLAAIRLSAHLMARRFPDQDPALGGAEIETLSLRAAALVAQLRPLLSPDPERRDTVDTAEVLRALARGVAFPPDAATRLRVATGRGLPALRADPDALHHVLVSLVLAAAGASPPARRIRVSAAAEGRRVVLQVDDDGPRPEPPALPPALARGRALAVALARAVLGSQDGRVRVEPRRGGTRVALSLPRAPVRPRRAPRPHGGVP